MIITNQLFFASAVAFIGILLSACLPAAVEAQVLYQYPWLRCSACRATVEVLGKKMNKTAEKDSKKTVLTSHRLDKAGGGGGRVDQRRSSYVNSELRGYDIIEKLCDQNSFGSYMLREEEGTALRIFSEHPPLQQCMPYDDADRKELHDTMASKFVGRMCDEVLEEHEEDIISVIKRNPNLDELTTEICDKMMKVCVGKKYEKGRKEEFARRAAWRKKSGIRTGSDQDDKWQHPEKLAAEDAAGVKKKEPKKVEEEKQAKETAEKVAESAGDAVEEAMKDAGAPPHVEKTDL